LRRLLNCRFRSRRFRTFVEGLGRGRRDGFVEQGVIFLEGSGNCLLNRLSHVLILQRIVLVTMASPPEEKAGSL
jgi:hypothetical protein